MDLALKENLSGNRLGESPSEAGTDTNSGEFGNTFQRRCKHPHPNLGRDTTSGLKILQFFYKTLRATAYFLATLLVPGRASSNFGVVTCKHGRPSYVV